MSTRPAGGSAGNGVHPVGLTRDEAHGYRWNGAEPALPSVTGILGIVDKSGPLVGWAKREVANAAIRNLDTLNTMVRESGHDAAARWLGTIPGYQRDTAADVGSTVHAALEAITRGEPAPVSKELAPFVAAHHQWVHEWGPEFLAAEEMVCSLRHGYGGTADAWVRMDGAIWCLDYKTSKGVYPETALQLVGYQRADFIGRAGESRKIRIPPATRFGVLHLRPEGYRLIEFAVTDEEWHAFLAALRLYRWREGLAQSVMTERERE